MTRNGFTLVELMIAIAVAALLAGVAVLTVGSPGLGPSEAAMRFASRVSAARDQSILGGRPISVWVTASGYGFDQLRNGRWERLEQKPFEGDDWGPGMQVGLTSTGARRARVRFDTVGVAHEELGIKLSRSGESAAVRISASGDVAVK